MSVSPRIVALLDQVIDSEDVRLSDIAYALEAALDVFGDLAAGGEVDPTRSLAKAQAAIEDAQTEIYAQADRASRVA